MILRAYLGVILTVLFWGANAVAAKVLLGHFAPGMLIALRLGLAGVILLALSLWRHGWPRWDGRTWVQVTGVGLIGNAAFQTLFLAGVARSPAGIAGLTNAVVPVAVVLIGLGLGVRPGARQALGVLVSLAGMAWLLGQTLAPGSAVDLSGLGLLGLAALSWAAYTMLSGPLSVRLGTLPFVGFSIALGSLPYLLIELPALPSVRAPLPIWGLLAVTALAANVFAYLAWAGGVRTLGAARTTIWQNLAPLVALALGAALLGERLSAAELLAAGIILAGVILANWPAARAGRARPDLAPES